eukprot:TRINITY_DN18786_c0_g1_i1.p1 TRINITY_DN18786_c0_g1~~TRINITY_DN18786_c0_g1_i1.p1  ORF type:complete len:586 (+),score=66.54 TRINITY_DN18786_c0_g1_i1:90-1847(+)
MRDDGTASGDKPTIEDVGGRSDGDASVPCDCRKEDAMTTETVAASGPVDDRGSCSALPVDDVLQAQTSSASDATHHGQVPVTHAGAKFGFAQTVVEGTVGRSNMPDSDEIPSCINDVPHGTSDGKRIEADREDYPTSTSPKPAQQLPPGGFDESHPKQNDLCCDPSCKGSVQEDRGLQKTADTCTIPSGDQDTWHADSQTDLEVPGARGGIEVDSSTREVSQVDSGDSRKCGLQTGTSCSTEGITDHDLELRAKAGLEGTAADLGHRVRPDVMHGCIEPGKAAEHALAEPAHSLVAATFGTQAPESPFFHPAPSPIDGVLSDSPLEPSQLQGKVTLSASDAKVPTTPPASAHPQSYQIGDRVEYWSKTIGAWIPGLIRNCHEQNGAMTVYDLDCKKGARVEMIRLRQKPRQRVVTASKKAADTRAVTRKHSSLAHGGSARGLEKGPIGKDSKKKAASPPGSMGPADGSRNTLRKSHVAGSERNREKRSSGNDADELVHRFKRELAEVQDASFQARRQAAAKTVAEAQTRDTRRRKRAGKAAWQTIKGLLEDACVAGGSGESPREKKRRERQSGFRSLWSFPRWQH